MKKLSKAEKLFVLSCLLFVIILAGIHLFSTPHTAEPLPAPTQQTAALRFNLNTATVEDLKQLPGIGDVLAERIVAYQEAHGGFHRCDELKLVKGIGDIKYAAILEFIYV